MDIVGPPVADGLRSLLRRVRLELTVVSPWVKMEGVDEIASVLRRSDVHCRVLMRGDLADFVSGASDIGAVRRLLEAGAWVGQGRDLHAKVYLADRTCALVGSANLTGAGMHGNAELGVIVDDEPTVAILHGLLDEWFARAREIDAEWLAQMERAAGECSAEKRRAAAAEDMVRRRGHALGGPRIWSGTRRSRGGVAPAAPFREGLWSEQLAVWLERKKLASLVPDAIRFFGLALANLPEEAYEWAYWGALPRRVSIIVGNVWTAAIHQGSEGRTVHLLVADRPEGLACDYKPAKSTTRYEPLEWLTAPSWDWLAILTERADVWETHREACRRLLAAPLSRRIIVKNNARKVAVSELISPTRVGSRTRPDAAPVAAPFPEGVWSQQLAAWLERKKLGSLVPDAVRFFGLALANLPEEAYEWAYWGALKTRVSLTVGNLWVATLAQRPRRVDLLVTGDVDVQGGEYGEAPSTSDYTPVGWIVVPGWEGLAAFNGRQDVWASYRGACIRLLDAPVSRTMFPKNNANKTPVADLLAEG